MANRLDRSAVRRAILKQWMAENDRGPTWVARRVGYTPPYLSNVLGGKHPFADALVRACQQHLGIDFGSMGVQEDVEESELLPAAALMDCKPEARRQYMRSGLSTFVLYLNWSPGGRTKSGAGCGSPLSSTWKLYECVGSPAGASTCTALWVR